MIHKHAQKIKILNTLNIDINGKQRFNNYNYVNKNLANNDLPSSYA